MVKKLTQRHKIASKRKSKSGEIKDKLKKDKPRNKEIV